MRLDDHRQSDNLEDRRGSGSGGGGRRLGGGRLGIGSIAIALVASYFLGVNPLTVLSLLSGGDLPTVEQSAPAAHRPPADDPMARFVSKVLASTEDTWHEVFRANGRHYQEPKLVLFTGTTPTACGTGQSAMGPFYCPADHKVYIDLAFYRDLKERFQAPGEFAQAYVIAHEVGHHVQTVTGVSDEVRRAQSRGSEEAGNAMQVRMELQADCYAGVWAYYEQDRLDPGDIDSGLAAAAAVGDDTLQKKMQGYVVPESFTHGTAAQRQRWFRAGLARGRPEDCDTFNASSP
jgi:predicted metalloprotease